MEIKDILLSLVEENLNVSNVEALDTNQKNCNRNQSTNLIHNNQNSKIHLLLEGPKMKNPIIGELDTGSNWNLISEEQVDKIGIEVNESINAPTLKAANGEELHIAGECDIQFQMGTKEVKLSFYVVKKLTVTIISWNRMAENGRSLLLMKEGKLNKLICRGVEWIKTGNEYFYRACIKSNKEIFKEEEEEICEENFSQKIKF